MRARPKRLRIMGQVYEVRTVKPKDPPIVVGTATGYVGAHHRGAQIIEVVEGKDMGVEQVIETFLHEALHAIVSQGRLIHYLHGDEDEPFVDVFAPQLQAFLRDNPMAVAYIMGDER